MSFVTTDGFSVMFTKISVRNGVLQINKTNKALNNELNKLWPYYQKDVNQITLNHITL